jgi:hypothetical protein
MHRIARIAGAILGVLLLSITASLADDWVAVKLRGSVMQLVGDAWVPLKRNDIVSDDRAVRTAFSGRVTFQRDAEIIELGPNTQIRIHDRTGKRFTVVEEHFGTVSVEAEVQNVQHFAVETPFLAAVVKGTKFIVTSNDNGSSVKVTRGAVAVAARVDGSRTVVRAGQSASVASGALAGAGASANPALEVSGAGDLPAVVVGAVGDTLGAVGDSANELLDDLLGGLGGGSGHGGGSGGGGGGNGGGGGSGGSGPGDGSGSSGSGDEDDDEDDDGGPVGGLLRRLL